MPYTEQDCLDKISDISSSKALLRTSIIGKGVSVPSSTKLSGYAAKIDSIQTYIYVSPSSRFVSAPATAGYTTITVAGNTSWTASVTGGCDFLTISNVNSTSFRINYTANSTGVYRGGAVKVNDELICVTQAC